MRSVASDEPEWEATRGRVPNAGQGGIDPVIVVSQAEVRCRS